MTSTTETNPSPAMAELAARYLNTTVEELAINRLTGDASTRSYFRARSNEASVIICIYGAPFDETERASDRLAKLESLNPSVRLTFANDPCAHIEVTRLLAEAGLPVPRILEVAGSDAILVIEDVGDARLQDWLEGRSGDEVSAAYRRAVAMIVRIQEATEMALGADSICSRLAFDEAKLRWELGFFFANYFNRYLHMRLDPETSNAVQADFKSLCADLSSRPRVLVHRDYHARNLMMHKNEMFIIDHQDARMGPASYDLASLISDPYTALDAGIAADMIERFIEMKAASSMPVSSITEFRQEIELMTVQRMLKAIGTYASQAALANNSTYVAYIEPARERALAAMVSLDRFETTRALLEKTRA
jgi:aminoglycoside/choline kinase family phosphotransferase